MAEIERMAALCLKDIDDEEIGDEDLEDEDLLVMCYFGELSLILVFDIGNYVRFKVTLL